MDALRNRAQTARSMVNRIHRRDHGEEDLCRANIAGGFVAADVLFARLEREPIAWFALGIVRNADEPAWHMAFVLITGGEIGGVWSAEAEWNAKALGVANRDIRTKFSRRRSNGT